MEDETRFDVDTRALIVDGLDSLHDLRMDGVLHLAEPTLGMPAGFWRVGAWQLPYYGAPAHTRDLQPISAEDAAAFVAGGHTVHEANRAPAWDHPFALEITGLRLDALRTALADLTDMPGDAVVVVTSASHAWEGRHSPADTYISTGVYVPNPSGGNYGRIYHDELADEREEDGLEVPAGAVPAVLLSPTN
ncbi:hypothetical protein [Streptomyces nigrescens]|uniref:hypothetical protein n=1 Tax=Streptomyces nigrescens TaxID=1920 RepID=UPI0036FB5302